MKTVSEINKAINQAIESALYGRFDYQIPLLAEDLSEPIVRPSIKVVLDDAKSGKYNSCSREMTLKYSVYFFAKNRIRPKSENIKIMELLADTFLCDISVDEDFHIPIRDINFAISDGVLICNIELYTIELLSGLDLGELMEELVYKKKEGGNYGHYITKH